MTVRRRIVSVGTVAIAVAALVLVLLNATLVDRRGPSISGVVLSAPVDGQTNVAHTLTAIDVQFSEPVRTGTVERRFRISPYVAGAISWDGSTATFTPSEKLPPDTEFLVTVEAGFEDLAGNRADAGLEAFAFRTVGPPVVASTDPVDGTEGVPIEASITITFDRLMDTTSVEEAINVEPGAAVRPSWSGQSLTLAFDAPLLFGMEYTVTVGTDAADTDGSRLRAPFSTTFTTVAAGLRILDTVPADGIAGIAVRTPIAVVFDGPIDAGTIEGALSITPQVGGDLEIVALPDDTAVRGEDDPPPPGTVLLFRPTDPLAPHTTYTVRLDPIVARDGAPDQVAAGRTWTFTTGQPTASGHNHVAWLTERGGTRDVWLMNPDGSAPRQLTTGLAPVSAFDVTVDGTRVAFAAGGVVRTMSIDGSDEAVLTSEGRIEYAPRFSPDGRRLLLARREPDGTAAGWWVVPLDAAAGDEQLAAAVASPPLGSTALEGEGIDPQAALTPWAARSAWEAGGRWIALVDGNDQVVLVDLEADDPAAGAIQTGVRSTGAPVWSPARQRFLIVGRADGEAGDALWAIATDGATSRVADASGTVAVTEDAVAAFLVTDGSGASHAAVARSDGSAPPVPLTSGATYADRWPTFSPGGETVLFGRVDADEPDVSAGIWTVTTDGGDPVPLTTGGAFPRWLP